MPPIRRSSSSVFVITANAPIAPPIAIEPVSPMKTSAGKALYQRKPIAPPVSAAPRIARSRAEASRSSVARAERIHVTTFIAVNVISAIIPTPTASPSIPSVRFAPFAAPAMIEEEEHVEAERERDPPVEHRGVDVRREPHIAARTSQRRR